MKLFSCSVLRLWVRHFPAQNSKAEPQWPLSSASCIRNCSFASDSACLPGAKQHDTQCS